NQGGDVRPRRHLWRALRAVADRPDQRRRRPYRRPLHALFDRRRDPRRRRVHRRTRVAGWRGARRPDAGFGRVAAGLSPYLAGLADRGPGRDPDRRAGFARRHQPGERAMSTVATLKRLHHTPWIWSFIGAAAVWIATIAFTEGQGAGEIVTAALSFACF